jgi:ERCC4-type nuclease
MSSLARLDDRAGGAGARQRCFAALDDRERGLIGLLPSWTVSHLSIGDIWIGLDSDQPARNGLILERKTAADLEASILDGRYREQRARLLAVAAERQAHPVYVIEGDLDRLGARLSRSALWKHLTRLALRYHITIFQTACLQETADLCQLLAEQWQVDPTTFEMPAKLSYVEQRGGQTRQGNSDDPEVFAVSVLTSCRGISAAGAKAVLEGCGGSLEGVWRASAAQLAAIVVGKRKLGAAVGGRLHSLLHSGATGPQAKSPPDSQ